MIEGLFIAVISGLIILFFNRSSIFKQPKIHVSFKKSGSAYSAVRDRTCQADWKGSLIFKNFSSYPAFNLSFKDLSETNPFQNLLPQSLKLMPNEEFELRTAITKIISIEERNNISTSSSFEPDKYKNISIVLCYENEAGKSFYTKYIKESKSESCKYKFIN
jgi:hypothetical protein